MTKTAVSLDYRWSGSKPEAESQGWRWAQSGCRCFLWPAQYFSTCHLRIGRFHTKIILISNFFWKIRRPGDRGPTLLWGNRHLRGWVHHGTKVECQHHLSLLSCPFFFFFFNFWRIKRKMKYLLNPNLYQKFRNKGLDQEGGLCVCNSSPLFTHLPVLVGLWFCESPNLDGKMERKRIHLRDILEAEEAGFGNVAFRRGV